MALIEYLEHDNWRETLRRSFEGAMVAERTAKGIALLQTDRFRPTSSTMSDDVRSWLTNGGVSRVQLQIDRQMEGRHLAWDRQSEIRDFLGQLVQEKQSPLMHQMADGIIPWNQADFLVICGICESDTLIRVIKER